MICALMQKKYCTIQPPPSKKKKKDAIATKNLMIILKIPTQK